MDDSRRGIIGLIVIVSIVALVLFARGPEDAGRDDGSPPDAAIELANVRVDG
jgi:hypothetical protein